MNKIYSINIFIKYTKLWNGNSNNYQIKPKRKRVIPAHP